MREYSRREVLGMAGIAGFRALTLSTGLSGIMTSSSESSPRSEVNTLLDYLASGDLTISHPLPLMDGVKLCTQNIVTQISELSRLPESVVSCEIAMGNITHPGKMFRFHRNQDNHFAHSYETGIYNPSLLKKNEVIPFFQSFTITDTTYLDLLITTKSLSEITSLEKTYYVHINNGTNGDFTRYVSKLIRPYGDPPSILFSNIKELNEKGEILDQKTLNGAYGHNAQMLFNEDFSRTEFDEIDSRFFLQEISWT